MGKPKLKVKSSYTWRKATLVGAFIGLLLFWFYEGAPTTRTLIYYLFGGALISNMVWTSLSVVDRFLVPRISARSLTTFLIKYASLSFLLGSIITLLGLYFVELFFRIRILSNPKTVFLSVFVVIFVTTLISSINFAQAFYREALETEKARQLADRAELKALKAQINPHFLFNTLNTVVQLIRADPEKAEAVVLSLSHVFRYVLKSLECEMVTLAEELECLQAYLTIEKARFEDLLQVTVDIPQDLLSVRLPPIILQPIVENSIKHGITPKFEGGRLEIIAQRCDSKLKLTIKDDGVGFDIDQAMRREHHGIGLRNVQERLVAVFDFESHLHIESCLGKGTQIWFQIPV